MAEPNSAKENVARIQLSCYIAACPNVEIYHDSGKVVITDDSGGKVTLTKEQWREAVAKVKLE